VIKINGTTIEAPSTYQVNIEDISKADRNANGFMIIERIATKRKIEMSWNYLTQSRLSVLMQAVSQVFFTVEYIDPQDGAAKTGSFYSGGRSAGAIDYKNGEVRWKDIKVRLQ
jgi:hypothetical protein